MEVYRQGEDYRLRNIHEVGFIPDDDVDLAHLDLQLHGEPGSNNLAVFAVFIQDPKKSDIYWFRMVDIERRSMQPAGAMEKKIANVHISKRNTGDVETLACQSYFLDYAITLAMMLEEVSSENAGKGTVGVAKYTGQREISVDGIASLAAIKFSTMQTPTPHANS